MRNVWCTMMPWELSDEENFFGFQLFFFFFFWQPLCLAVNLLQWRISLHSFFHSLPPFYIGLPSHWIHTTKSVLSMGYTWIIALISNLHFQLAFYFTFNLSFSLSLSFLLFFFIFNLSFFFLFLKIFLPHFFLTFFFIFSLSFFFYSFLYF